MPYVTSVERMGIKKGQLMGIELGKLEGTLLTSREADTDVLEARFEAVPKSMMNKIKKINDPPVLKMLHKKAITAGSLKEFKMIMDKAIG